MIVASSLLLLKARSFQIRIRPQMGGVYALIPWVVESFAMSAYRFFQIGRAAASPPHVINKDRSIGRRDGRHMRSHSACNGLSSQIAVGARIEACIKPRTIVPQSEGPELMLTVNSQRRRIREW